MGTLTFKFLEDMYISTCFAKYPQFHIQDTISTGKVRQNNTNDKGTHCNRTGHTVDVCRTKKYDQRGKGGKGGGKGNGRNGRGRGRGSGDKFKGKFEGNCNHCGKHDHTSRYCKTRLYEEEQKKTKTQANTDINQGVTQLKSSLKTETSSESTLPVPPPTGFAVDFNQYPSFLNLPSHITFSDKKEVVLFEENSPIFQAGMPQGFASNSTQEFLDNLGQVAKKDEDDGGEAYNRGYEDSLDEHGNFSLPPPSTKSKNLGEN